jgi:hypothetical protein
MRVRVRTKAKAKAGVASQLAPLTGTSAHLPHARASATDYPALHAFLMALIDPGLFLLRFPDPNPDLRAKVRVRVTFRTIG